MMKAQYWTKIWKLPSCSSDNSDCDSSMDCRYLDCREFNLLAHKLDSLSFFHLNINSLSKHFDNLLTLCNDLKSQFKIIALTETRLTSLNKSLNNFSFSEYSFLSNDSEAAAGGTALFINNSINYKVRMDFSNFFYLSRQLESTFVEIIQAQRSNIIVGCIYKHPGLSTSIFNTIFKFLAPLLDKINREKKDVVLLGDFNINLLHHDSNTVLRSFVDILDSNFILPTINIPTRITNNTKTLIDNILVSASLKGHSGNLTVGISDHLPQFFICQEVAWGHSTKTRGSYKDWKNFNIDRFSQSFREINWKETLQLKMSDPSVSFEIL